METAEGCVRLSVFERKRESENGETWSSSEVGYPETKKVVM